MPTSAERQRFRDLEELFYAAIDLPPGAERHTLIRDLCGVDESLRVQATLLLADHDRIQAAAPAPTLRLPLFGVWQAVRLLGRGGVGTVYLAERADGVFRMSAAVKVVPLALASSEIEERFRRERQFLAGFDHPKIARLIDGGVSETGLPYLVMEFVAGLTIEKYCETHGLDTRARIVLIRQVLEALDYVHGRHVVHRDVKPSNIMVDDSGSVKLLDFGTARLVDASAEAALTQTGVFAFTPEYVSPEHARGEVVTIASDLYSTGVLLYRVLTGHLPYRIADRSPGGVADLIAHAQVEPPRLGASLDALLAKALSKNAADRYQSATEMDADLVRYLEGAPVRATRQSRDREGADAAIITAPLRSRLGSGVATPRLSRRIWLWFCVGLLAVAGLAGTLQFFRTHFAGNPSSIVVLPFTCLRADSPKAYFADGLTDEITDDLAHIKSLRVVSRTSALMFKNKPADVRAVGRQLNVTHVLQGSVEWFGEQARIIARLSRTSDGSQIWSETYDRQGKDLLTIQSELAQAVARSLQLNSRIIAAPRHVPSEEAHDLLLRAAFDMQDLSTDALKKAQETLERVVRIDPQYATAWFRLAIVKFTVPAANGRSRTPAEMREVKSLYQKALSLDPDLAGAHANLGSLAMIEWDWAGADRELKLASLSGPNASAEIYLALIAAYRGRFGEADRRMAAALSLDPLSSVIITYVGSIRYWEGRFPEAIAIHRQLLDRFPDQLNARLMLNLSRIEAGQAELALTDIRPLEAKFPPGRIQEVMALARLGRREEALRLLRQLETEYGHDPRISRQWFAMAWASLGDHAQTMKWLERSADLREFQVLNMAVNPGLAEMRNDPAFRALIKRIGLM